MLFVFQEGLCLRCIDWWRGILMRAPMTALLKVGLR